MADSAVIPPLTPTSLHRAGVAMHDALWLARKGTMPQTMRALASSRGNAILQKVRLSMQSPRGAAAYA